MVPIINFYINWMSIDVYIRLMDTSLSWVHYHGFASRHVTYGIISHMILTKGHHNY